MCYGVDVERMIMVLKRVCGLLLLSGVILASLSSNAAVCRATVFKSGKLCCQGIICSDGTQDITCSSCLQAEMKEGNAPSQICLGPGANGPLQGQRADEKQMIDTLVPTSNDITLALRQFQNNDRRSGL
jgi:hypothetical protein